MPKITKKSVDAAKPKDNEYFIWDDDLAGFGLRVFPSGKKSYVVQYRQHRRTRRIAIGAHGVFTPDEARKEAKGALGEVARGGDPAEVKARAREDMSVADLCDKYIAEGCGHKKASTIETDTVIVFESDNHVAPIEMRLLRLRQSHRDFDERRCVLHSSLQWIIHQVGVYLRRLGVGVTEDFPDDD